tara:strand:- start:823 stop:963 length:141 start_codon:yes stop_codon:yes gene_type:complete
MEEVKALIGISQGAICRGDHLPLFNKEDACPQKQPTSKVEHIMTGT